MRLRLLCSIVCLTIPLAAVADCARDKPPAIPDGAKATEAEMVSAQTAIKAYMGGNEAYRKCLDAEAAAEAKGRKDKPSKEEVEKDQARTAAYNASIDEEEATVNAFNAARKAYFAAHPK